MVITRRFPRTADFQRISEEDFRVPNAAEKLFKEIDPLNFTTVRLELLFDNLLLSNATGFFVSGDFNGKPNYWLVTNWHVLTGRHPDDPLKTLDPNGAVPNKMGFTAVLDPTQPEYARFPPGNILLGDGSVEL